MGGAQQTYFIARQPIFDRAQHICAYELLFRTGPQNVYTGADGDQATVEVISHLLCNFGLDSLVGRKRAFINFGRNLLLQKTPAILPANRVVVEILEEVQPDAEVLEACRALKHAGYTLALDDFAMQGGKEPLASLVDIIKVDFTQCKSEQERRGMMRYAQRGTKLLAEKVETREESATALAAGYQYLQGFFFCRPQLVSRHEVPIFKLNYMRFLHEVNRPDLNIDALDKLIRQEVSLSVKLLRFINSAMFGLRRTVESIRWGLVILGERAIRRWASLLAMKELCSDKPAALAVTCMVRARFCELVHASMQSRLSADQFFLMGMLSVLDAMLDQPMEEVLVELPVSSHVKDALLGKPSSHANVLGLVRAYEHAEWDEVSGLASGLKLADERIFECYQQATAWTDKLFGLGLEPQRASGRFSAADGLLTPDDKT
ncbi:MAG: HDOD domain-containing protein [Planctomycetota bacterium]